MADVFDMADTQVNKKNDSDSDSTASDWDIDSEEEEQKKQEKAAAKAKKEEEERLKKEREEATRRRNAERKEAERKKKEAKLAELNRLKSPEELKEEEEAREMEEADDFLGCGGGASSSKNKAEDRLTEGVAKVAISAPIITNTENDKPSLFNFAPKNPSKMTRAEAMTLAGYLTDKLFQYKDDPNFIVVVDQVFRQTATKHEDEDWEKIRQFGKTISAISNEKQQSHKKKTEKKKRGGKKPKQAISRADDFEGDLVDDDFDGFM